VADKMRITKNITEEVEIVTDVICNMCGESCLSKRSFNGIIDAYVEGGFDSTHLKDCTRYTFSVCEKCVKEWFDNFKIPVEITEYFLGDYIPPKKRRYRAE
jgi:hypothetical protein